MDDKVSDVGEKPKFRGIRAGRTALDLKRFGFGHDRTQSESEVNREHPRSRKDILIVSA